MKRMGSKKGGDAACAGPAARTNDSLIDSGIATLERATSMDRLGQLEEAVALYGSGIELLLQGAREEPAEQRRQTLMREASVHMSRAESIKAALAPPAPPRRHFSSGGGGLQPLGEGKEKGRGIARGASGQGKAALSRPAPTGSDVTGSIRINGTKRSTVAFGRGTRSVGLPSNKATYPTGGAGTGGQKTSRPTDIAPTARRTTGDGAAAAAATRGGASSGIGGTFTKKEAEKSELQDKILGDMLDRSPGVSWDSIAGLEYAKQTLQEAVILPNLRPDLFKGLRAPAKGVLLYGPPGTGKTMLAKAVATESGYAFFNISASSLTSKYVGEGEKMVRALFAAARERQPAVIFIDEIDSVLTARGEAEHEATRRLKTEFLVQLDGVGQGQGQENGSEDERLLVLAATNLPQELDEAALRRLSKRVYVPLPDPPARKALLSRLLAKHKADIKGAVLMSLVEMTDGYSGSDLKELCKEAAMQPIRDLGSKVRTVAAKDVRAINLDDFRAALPRSRPSVSKKTIERYVEWERSLSGS